MLVKDAMTARPWTAAGTASARQAARIMARHDVGVLPVCSATGRLLGMVTDRDLLIRGMAAGRDPDTTQVSSLMTRDPAWCLWDETVEAAAQVMESRRVRRLPVLDGRRRVIGLLSIDDIARPAEFRELAGDVLEEAAGSRPATGRARRPERCVP